MFKKGYKQTKEHKRKISEALRGDNNPAKRPEVRKKMSETKKGQHYSPKTEFKKGIIPWNKGRRNVYSEEILKKMREANRNHYIKNPKLKEQIAKKLKGRKLSEEHKRKISFALRGEKSSLWKGGKMKNYPELEKIRKSAEYELWKKTIVLRDNFICQNCGIKGGGLIAHHINNFADFPELRLAIDNGITFCKNCHNKFHKKYGKENNTKGQLEEFLRTIH